MKITKEWLNEIGACQSGIEWFLLQKTQSPTILLKKALAQNQFAFANWGLTRLMTHQQAVQYGCFAALQSLARFEKVYPQDKRPREAIQAALKWALDPTEANKSAAESAAWSAWSAAESARSAALSAWSAWSAWSAAESARSAAWSAWSAESAAESAAWSAWSAWSAESAAESAAWKKILLYGLKIITKQILIKSVDHFLGVK